MTADKQKLEAKWSAYKETQKRENRKWECRKIINNR